MTRVRFYSPRMTEYPDPERSCGGAVLGLVLGSAFSSLVWLALLWMIWG